MSDPVDDLLTGTTLRGLLEEMEPGGRVLLVRVPGGFDIHLPHSAEWDALTAPEERRS